MVEIEEIGVIRSSFKKPADPFLMKEEESRVEVHEAFSEGLYGIEENRFLQIIFHLHKANFTTLRTEWYYGGERGVFSCRTPHRPGAVGVTEVELKKRSGRTLIVKGLDALDGTPVLDIKPAKLRSHQHAVEQPADFIRRYPRSSMIHLLRTGNLYDILLGAGTLHGHYCPGLASGVLAAFYGMKALSELTGVSPARMQNSEGMKELIASVETNGCFADGIQYVSGCTLGNTRLICRDSGKAAVTFCLREYPESEIADKKVNPESESAQPAAVGHSVPGIRICLRVGMLDCADEIVPEYRRLFKKAVEENLRDPEIFSRFRKTSADVSFAMLDRIGEEDFIREEVEFQLP